MSSEAEQKPRWVDTTINVQTLVTGLIGAAVALVVVYIGLIGRVSTLEIHDAEQEKHFDRVERAMDQQRSDINTQLRSISSDVKDTNVKVDKLNEQLLLNTAGNRPALRGWAK
jgi:sensor domain CHASE-containing protein